MANLYYYLNQDIRYKTLITQMTFPGGEVGVNVNTGSTVDDSVSDVGIVAHIQNSNDVMALLLATEALRYAYPHADVSLCMPYIPYARQDRRCNYGEALSMKVFANLINSQNYKLVVVLDPHSGVSAALIDRLHIVDQYTLFSRCKLSWHDTLIVAPDLGAVKKTEDFAKRVGAAGVVVCNKKRELATGKIIGLEIVSGAGLLDKTDVVVLDDICDGGRTFIELADLLEEHNVGLMELYVTHGIFSKGVEVLSMYDTVVTTNSFHPDMKDKGNVEIVDFRY